MVEKLLNVSCHGDGTHGHGNRIDRCHGDGTHSSPLLTLVFRMLQVTSLGSTKGTSPSQAVPSTTTCLQMNARYRKRHVYLCDVTSGHCITSMHRLAIERWEYSLDFLHTVAGVSIFYSACPFRK